MTTKMRSYALLCLVVLGLFVASGAYADRDSPAAAAPSKDVGSLVEPSPANFAARLDEYNQSTNAGTLNSSKFNLEQNRNNYSYIVREMKLQRGRTWSMWKTTKVCIV